MLKTMVITIMIAKGRSMTTMPTIYDRLGFRVYDLWLRVGRLGSITNPGFKPFVQQGMS